MIDPRGGLIDDLTDSFTTKLVVEQSEQLHHISRRRLVAHDEASIGESLMGIESIPCDVSRQQGIQLVTTIHHQRMVRKAVCMIVHVVSVQQESTILGTTYKVIPRLLLVGCVSYYFEHPTYFKNSS